MNIISKVTNCTNEQLLHIEYVQFDTLPFSLYTLDLGYKLAWLSVSIYI